MSSIKGCVRESFRARSQRKVTNLKELSERLRTRPEQENGSSRSMEIDPAHQRVDALVEHLDGIVRDSRKVGLSNYQIAGPCTPVLDVPELAEWALDFVWKDLQRVNSTYEAMRGVNTDPGPLPYIRSEVDNFAARALGRADKLMSKGDERAVWRLHDSVARALQAAHHDFKLIERRIAEAYEARMQLRTDDIAEVLNPETGVLENDFTYSCNKEVWVNNLFASGEGHITSYNSLQFAQLQLIVSSYTNSLVFMRRRRLQPRLSELTALHDSLDRLLVGQTNLQDGWPRRADYKAPPKLGRDEQMKYMFPRFKNVRNVELGEDGRNVYAFIDNAQRYCAHEVHAMGMKLKIKSWQADTMLGEADKVLGAPRQGALSLKAADAFSVQARELPRAFETMSKERVSLRFLAKRLKRILDNRVHQGNVRNAFNDFGYLLTPEAGQRAYAYNAYEKMFQQLNTLDTQLSYGLRKLRNVHENIRVRLVESLKPPVQEAQ